MTAVEGRRSVATSMGMTPLEGLMMGTRAGSIDPGVPLALLRDGRLSLPELADALDHESGLLAMAGTADLREIVAAEARGDGAAALALQMFVRRAAPASPRLRRRCRPSTRWCSPAASASTRERCGRRSSGGSGSWDSRPISGDDMAEDAVLSGSGAGPAVLRIEAREDLVIAAQAARLAGGPSGRD